MAWYGWIGVALILFGTHSLACLIGYTRAEQAAEPEVTE